MNEGNFQLRAFSTSVFHICADLEQSYGFRASHATASKDFAALVARPYSDICYYLLIRDDRSGGGLVRADLWVAPPEIPDDSLESLGVGIKLLVGEIYEFDTTFLKAIVRRVILLLPALPALVDVVRQEIHHPIFHSQRQGKYRLEYEAYHRLVDFSRTEAGSYCRVIFETADMVVRGRKSYKSLEQICTTIASELLASEPILIPFDNPYFQNNPSFIGMYIASKVYIEALVPV